MFIIVDLGVSCGFEFEPAVQAVQRTAQILRRSVVLPEGGGDQDSSGYNGADYIVNPVFSHIHLLHRFSMGKWFKAIFRYSSAVMGVGIIWFISSRYFRQWSIIPSMVTSCRKRPSL